MFSEQKEEKKKKEGSFCQCSIVEKSPRGGWLRIRHVSFVFIYIDIMRNYPIFDPSRGDFSTKISITQLTICVYCVRVMIC